MCVVNGGCVETPTGRDKIRNFAKLPFQLLHVDTPLTSSLSLDTFIFSDTQIYERASRDTTILPLAVATLLQLLGSWYVRTWSNRIRRRVI